ncbi:MAG: acylneuraminate cytidylyltransferase family protein [Rhodothermales bacterium]|nr:acylneuraminate cytidylyltransferase family protein [Rhodothermales bacterium]
MTDVIAIIPARCGSKGVPGKNVTPVGGHPLLAWSIAAALQAPAIERVVVSTDSPDYASLAIAYGAEAPFLRPDALAGDGAMDRDFMVHAMQWMKENEGHVPEWWVLLRPTTPLRDPDVLDAAVKQVQSGAPLGLRSAHACAESPFKWFRRNDDGYFTGLISDDTAIDAYNLPRQAYEQVYVPNGYVDIAHRDVVMGSDGLFGDPVMAFETEMALEVDTQAELDLIRSQASHHPLKSVLDAGPRPSKTHEAE